MENPDEEFDVEVDWPHVTQEEHDANPCGFRELCWDLKVKVNLSTARYTVPSLRRL